MSDSNPNTPSMQAPSGNGSTIDQGSLTPGALIREIQKQQEEMLFIVQSFLKALKMTTYILAYPVLLFRRNIGERILSIAAFCISWFIAALVAVSSGVSLAYLITLAMPVLYGVHRFQIKRRSKRGERHYSYCRGSSWLDCVLPNRPELTTGIVEPLLLIVAAIAVSFFGDQFMIVQDGADTGPDRIGSWVCSLYLAGMGASLFFVESRLKKQAHNTLLDHIDQQIISTYFASALNETQEITDEGFSIASLAGWNPEQRSAFAAAATTSFSRGEAFDPAWENLLDATPAP